MRSFYSPLRYPGGKNCNFSFVSKLIKENDLVGCNYIEPYAGGAGLALRLLYEEYVQNIVLNDFDPIVYAFWNTCHKNPEKIISWIESIQISIENWIKCKEVITNKDNYEEFDLATAFLFLNRTNISGIMNGGVIGGLNQSGKYKIDARFNKKAIIEKIIKFSKFANRITILNRDGVGYLKNFSEEISSDSLVYLDPPYYQKGSNLYLNFYKDKDHIELAEIIPKINCYWLLSYDNCHFIKDLYRNLQMYSYDLHHSTSNKKGKELIVLDKKMRFRSSLELLSNIKKIDDIDN